MNKSYKPTFQEIIEWFETNDFEELKGKIQGQKREWKHEEELKANKGGVK